MKSPKTYALSAMALAVSTLLAACGGSSDDDGPTTPELPARQVTGYVLDRDLSDATACLDLNDNRACDADEPKAMTANGAFSITTTAANDAIVLVQATAQSRTSEGAVVAPYTLTAPLGRHAVITPFTTLLQSEIDSGRSANVLQAEETLLSFLVGTAGQVGGIQLYDNYQPAAGTEATVAQQKMLSLGQLLTRGFAEASASAGADSRAALNAYSAVAPGSLQQLLYQIPATLTPAQRESLFLATRDSLVPTAKTLASIAKAKAATAAQPIEGAWIKTDGATRELYLFAGDGSFVHQVIETPVGANYAFDNGLAYRYGRYSLAGGTLTLELLEAANARGPAAGAHSVAIAQDAMTLNGASLTRVASAGNPLVGAWVRPMGLSRPEYLVVFADGRYVHGTFYYQNDRQTGTATALETAKSVGLQVGSYAVNAADAKVIDFGETTIDFNGNLSVPGNPGAASVQADGSLSLAGLRLVKLGSTLGAQAVAGFTEATRSRIWSGRYFSRTLSGTGASAVVEYLYVKGPGDIQSFTNVPVLSTEACPVQAAPFANIDPSDGVLKQFVIGTGTAASATYAQRRMAYGTPASFVALTPVARPTNAAARCAVPF
ncbi:hypothetical protein [Pseudorhodoferax sp. Leaf267]|uniref:hypothetical protein n=1 Tax=Pseudorhodoferax sp. Leaf267 TaxID=1736316 RepID=UPI00071623BA|nr:hypothetical protein [Pseudorhodoferax sp. Leaf267]KQP23078.1 hypothetical protein ASF43_04130 [Pseudorhodoferax sp. Leaf267]